MNTPELLFRALSDRTRLRILCILRGGETCVGDLVQLLDVPQPAASRHLAYLRKAGLVEVQREGLWAFYSLAKARGAFQVSLFKCLDACCASTPELKRDVRSAARLRKSGGCCPVVPGAARKGCSTRAQSNAKVKA